MSLGSVDLQKDHRKEQREEEEDVRGFHRDSSTAHVAGGLNTLLLTVFDYFVIIGGTLSGE